MLEKIAAALDRQDYETAAQLIQAALQKSPKHPLVQIYLARLHEATGNPEEAESLYRKSLQETVNAKIALQARQGLQRLEEMAEARRQQAIDEATADPSSSDLGFLVLEPVSGEARPQVLQSFARIMKLDPYLVRMQFPSRGWQLYRTGAMWELEMYGQELRKGGVPVRWATIAQIEQIQVFRVSYFESVSPQITVVCQNDADQLGALNFNWSEVTQRVQGRLPIFERVVDLDAHRKLQRKTKTQDYAQIYDLHLPRKNCILRLCDLSYQFQEGIIIESTDESSASVGPNTARINWNSLLGFLNQQLPQIPLVADFTTFGETTLDHRVPLSRLRSHIDIPRKAETHWDPAFHLYSALAFLKQAEGS